MKMPLCECGERLEVFTGFTGADYDCEAGEGSGYGWEVSLVCPHCSRFYPIAFTKNQNDISWHLGVAKHTD